MADEFSSLIAKNKATQIVKSSGCCNWYTWPLRCTWPLVSLKSGSSLTRRDPNFTKTSGRVQLQFTKYWNKELYVAAQQASFHLAMANMHVMYDTQRACSPSLITRNVDHFEKRAARGRPASQLSLSDGQYACDV